MMKLLLTLEMAMESNPALAEAVRRYSQAIARHQIGSAEALAIRDEYAGDQEFIAYADAFDRLHTKLLAKASSTAAVGQKLSAIASVELAGVR